MTATRLNQWRTERGLSQSEASRRCGVHRNSWRAWESGDKKPPAWLGYVLRAVGDGLPPYI